VSFFAFLHHIHHKCIQPVEPSLPDGPLFIEPCPHRIQSLGYYGAGAYALMLTAGNVSDVKAAPALLKQAGRMRYLLADKGYDADQLRRSHRDSGAVPVIPGRRSRKRAICYDKERYRGRHLIENAFCRLNQFLILVNVGYDRYWHISSVCRGARDGSSQT
jgi:transposase